MLVEHAIFFGLLFVWCVIVAWLEVEIEGKNGWAKNAPTWKYKLDSEGRVWYKPFGVEEYRESTCSKKMNNFYRWCIKTLAGGKEFTGYHRAVDAVQVFVGHMVLYAVFHSTPWWVLEIRIIAFVFLAWSIEDTLWFRLNPFYKDGKLAPEWHPDWNRHWKMSRGMGVLFLLGCGVYALTCTIMFFIK